MIQPAIKRLTEKEDLTEAEAIGAMQTIMDGAATPAQIGGFLMALRMKGETVSEITGCARVMREKASRIVPKADFCVDTCGTGGDNAHTFNISTAAAFVAAAGGVTVAKHGNRSVSSLCGSADVLEALGVNITLTPEQVCECINNIGIGFLFALSFHPSMKHAAQPRRDLGVRTIFNILGPLTNPAGAKGQIMGVFDARLAETMAGVLLNLGTERALVVCGSDGLDEFTTTDSTRVSEVRDGAVQTYDLTPEQFGLRRAAPSELKGGDARANAEIILRIFKGEKGAPRDIVLLNAGAALYVGKKAVSLEAGVRLAAEAIDAGRALEKVSALASLTQTFQQAEKS